MQEATSPSIWQMLTPYLPVLITAISTLFAVYLSNRSSENRLRIQLAHEKDLKQRESKQSRLEELYIMIGQYSTALTSYFLAYWLAVSGKMTVDEALEYNMTRGVKDVPDYQRLQMLIDIHFPQLRQDFHLLINIRDDTNSKWRQCEKQLRSNGTLDKATRDSFLLSYASIDEAAKVFKNKASALAAG